MTIKNKTFKLGDPDFDICSCPKCGEYTYSGGACSNCDYQRD